MGSHLNFDEILLHLGDTGDSGDNPRQCWPHAEATAGRQGATPRATGASVAPVASASPCPIPAPEAETRPSRPCRPKCKEGWEIAPELEQLIRRAGTVYEYSPEDYELIRNLARNDPDGLRLALESDAFLEAFEERAAIQECNGREARTEAELMAKRKRHEHD